MRCLLSNLGLRLIKVNKSAVLFLVNAFEGFTKSKEQF
jgi:hypothetical protein